MLFLLTRLSSTLRKSFGRKRSRNDQADLAHLNAPLTSMMTCRDKPSALFDRSEHELGHLAVALHCSDRVTSRYLIGRSWKGGKSRHQQSILVWQERWNVGLAERVKYFIFGSSHYVP